MDNLTDDTPRADRQAERAVSNAAQAVRRMVQANLELTAGTAIALGKGYRRFGRSLTDDNVLRLGLDNGFLEGAFRAWEQTFGELQGVWERALSTLQGDSKEHADLQMDEPEPKPSPQPTPNPG